ncbi:MAG: T9SS type A sorting domain-containing protein, partial [bacterium]|nr:T9SS type A sorting domain-containing protein [Candidatus Kapabacteria bacterium]
GGGVAYAPDGSLLFSDSTEHYRTTDFGATWHHTGLVGYFRRFFTSYHGDIYSVMDEGLYRSANGNTEWKWLHPLNNGEPDALAAHTRTLLLLIQGSILRTDDDGISWRTYITGLEDERISALAADASGNFYAGTYKGGMFKLTAAPAFVRDFGTSVKNDPMNVSIDGDDVVLRYRIDGTGDASISIVDVRGTIVRSIVDENEHVGEQVERISIASLMPGVYFVRVRRGDSNMFARMLLHQ